MDLGIDEYKVLVRHHLSGLRHGLLDVLEEVENDRGNKDYRAMILELAGYRGTLARVSNMLEHIRTVERNQGGDDGQAD